MIIFLFLLVLGSDHFQVNLDAHGVFVAPDHVACADDGSLLISNGPESELLLFDGSGHFVKKTGRSGNGPAEYMRINGVTWVDSLGFFLVHDSGNSRITALSKNLDLVKEWSVKTFMNRPVHMTDKHVYILRDNNGDIGATPHVLRVNYQKPDKSVPYELPPLTVQYGVHFDEGGYSMFRSFDWDPKLLFALGETFFVSTFSDFSNTSPHFIIHDLSGKKKQKVSCSLVPTPLKAAALEGPIGAYPKIIPLIKKHMTIPKYWPAIVKLLVDKDRIYVFGPESPSGMEHAFEVYRVDGTYLSKGTALSIPVEIDKAVTYGFITKDEKIFFKKQPHSPQKAD